MCTRREICFFPSIDVGRYLPNLTISGSKSSSLLRAFENNNIYLVSHRLVVHYIRQMPKYQDSPGSSRDS
jgi:hypothetical protein